MPTRFSLLLRRFGALLRSHAEQWAVMTQNAHSTGGKVLFPNADQEGRCTAHRGVMRFVHISTHKCKIQRTSNGSTSYDDQRRERDRLYKCAQILSHEWLASDSKCSSSWYAGQSNGYGIFGGRVLMWLIGQLCCAMKSVLGCGCCFCAVIMEHVRRSIDEFCLTSWNEMSSQNQFWSLMSNLRLLIWILNFKLWAQYFTNITSLNSLVRVLEH